MLAAKSLNIASVKEYIAAGLDLNVRDSLGQTALIYGKFVGIVTFRVNPINWIKKIKNFRIV
jgi:hypothetical protein